MAKLEADRFRTREVQVDACRVREILKQPTFAIAAKERLPQWVRDLGDEGRIRVMRHSTDSAWLLCIPLPGEVDAFADGSAWLIRDERGDLWVREDKGFRAEYMSTSEPTARERRLGNELREARAAAERNYQLYERAHPGELPGRDTMG